MQFLQCECGKAKAYTSGQRMYDCQGCPECQTTFSNRPGGHRALQPHNWELRYNERTGQPDHYDCKDCMAFKPLNDKVVA